MTLKKKDPSNFKKVHRKIDENKNRIANFTNFDNVCKRVEEDKNLANKKISENIKHLENVLRENENISVRSPRNNGVSGTCRSRDCVDSNLKNINADIISKEYKCAKFYLPTLEHIDKFIEDVNVQRQRAKTFVHCGTNHTKMSIKGKISGDRNLCIILATEERVVSILPNSRYKWLLAYKLIFVKNSNIRRDMLVDNKHVWRFLYTSLEHPF